ncbi:Amino acid permease [Coniochaeta hoffmannii]|uniref:Amino acid permease n=1 Tax=Coniochaeta hoffmannii TaxID=91930 RepID=A0AA38VL79_9PEZI|nr:Amino acid permease [Coniochaeta hoffmannii]
MITPVGGDDVSGRGSASGSKPSDISSSDSELDASKPTPDGGVSQPVEPTKSSEDSIGGAALVRTETAASNGGFSRDITTRQMFLMAAGGSIGAGLFVGSGQALHVGGPASLVINFAICGFMVSMTMASLGEMATSYPVAGAFYDYTVRFVGETAGFAMGWNFVFNWLIVLPFELTTIGAQLEYWDPTLRPWWFIIPFMVVLALVSLKGAKWFGEVEHWLGLCKAVSLMTFICFAIALTTTGAASDSRGALGARYWHRPGAFLNGFQGFLAVFRVAGMSYGGTEMLGLTAAECRRPHRVMPMATKIVFFRLIVFYVGGLLMLGFLVPADNPNLSAVGHGAKYSPFVLAANLANQPALANFFNAMIVTALVSMANAAVFASSRALQALCSKGMGPRTLGEMRRGIPVYALAVAFALALLAFVTAAPGGGEIFDWLLSLSATSNYMTWAAICYSHVRMRKAMAVQRWDRGQIIWRSPFGVWGSYVGLAVCGCGLAAQVVVAAWPLGRGYDAKAVTRDVIGIPFILAIFGGYAIHQKWRKGERRLMVPLAEIDLATGFRNKEYARVADEEAAKEKELVLDVLGYQKEWSLIKKAGFHAKQQVNLGWVYTLRKRLGKKE